MKKKYRVWVQSIEHLYVDVEAENEDEAEQIGMDTDGGDFTPVTDAFGSTGSWDFDRVVELDENGQEK